MGKSNSKNIAVFLDRDGTLIHEKNYLRYIKDIHLFSYTTKALKLLKDAGYKLILVTNQSGIGRGYFTEKKLHQIHDYLQKILDKESVKLDGIYYCPHIPEDKCSCRKPDIGLIKKAQKEFNLDLKKCFMIGDHKGDFLLGQNMGGKGIFVLTGHGRQEYKKIKDKNAGVFPDRVEKDLYSAAKWILSEKSKIDKK